MRIKRIGQEHEGERDDPKNTSCVAGIQQEAIISTERLESSLHHSLTLHKTREEYHLRLVIIWCKIPAHLDVGV